MKKIVSALFAAFLVFGFISNANAAKTLKCQTVISAKGDEAVMLKDFTDNVTKLTGGSLKFEIMPAGTVVGVKETLDAVDKGLIDCGFAWTHYWSGEHPAAMLFGSPVAGGGVGIDNIAFLSWFLYGGGEQLYDRLWGEMKRDIKGFMLQPVGPEALGWFPRKIKDMDDFRTFKFRKHYYLQGLHQVVVNADFYLNKSTYDKFTDHEKFSMKMAADASLMRALAYRINTNGLALKDLTENHGVILEDTPADYFPAYMAAAKATLEKNAKENAFFKEVYDSMISFANTAVPFWSGAQTSNAKLGMAYANSLKK